jgi:hypothetical protein
MKKTLLLVVTASLCFSSVFALVIPKGCTSIYNLHTETEQCPYVVPATTSYQFIGPASGWGAATNYDLSSYKQLIFNLSFTSAAAGMQVAIRFSTNGGAQTPVILTLPTGVTTYTDSIPLQQYKDATGLIGLGGIVFYNGASHFSFSYTGTASAVDMTVNYIALRANAPTAISSVIADGPDAIVNVYSLTGSLVRKAVKQSEATVGLNPGVYIANGHKIFVTK